MACCVNDLRNKEVINVCDGKRLGCVCDVEVDVCDARVLAIIVPGEAQGLFSRPCEIRIPWACIQHIGEDIILVNMKELPPRHPESCHKKPRWW